MPVKEYEDIVRALFLSIDDTSRAVIDTLRLIQNQRHFYIMPQGLGGEDLLCRFRRMGIKAYAFCDNDPQKAGTSVMDTPVYSYQDMLADPLKLVLITSGIYYNEIRKQLEADAVDCLNATSFLDILGESVPAAKQYILDHIPEILKTRALFADGLSKEIFISALAGRLTRNPEAMAKYNRPEAEEYILPEYMVKGSRQVIFDCGAFVGDSVLKFREYFGPECSVVCFEPDRANYSKLLQACGEGACTCINAGVGARTGKLGFGETGTAGAHFDPNGSRQCLVYAIDDYCKESGLVPTLIKLDVEGFEMEALRGAEATIKMHQPQLAVCVYHKVSDYIDVPTYLYRLNPHYRLYLRQFSDRYTDTVCFAVAPLPQ